MKAFHSKLGDGKFDGILYVPTSGSDNALRHLAQKLGGLLGLHVIHVIVKTRATAPQASFSSSILRSENVKGAFSYQGRDSLLGKSVLLLDDFCETGSTIKEVSRILTPLGVSKITPLVLLSGKVELANEPVIQQSKSELRASAIQH